MTIRREGDRMGGAADPRGRRARAALYPGPLAAPPDRLDPELGVQHVAEPVPDQVDPEGGEGQGGAGEGGEPPRDVEEVAALRQHAAPVGGGGLDAEAEEGD